MTPFRTRMLALAAFCAALGTTATAQEPATKAKQPAKKEPVKKVEPAKKEPASKDEPQVVKAFELKTVHPVELQTVLTKHCTHAAKPVKPGTPVAPTKPALHIAFNARTNSVFVRGPAADVEAAGKVIAQLDSGSASGPLTVVRVQHASVQEVMAVLNALGLGGDIQPCINSKLLILDPKDADSGEIKTVIERLDKAPTPAPKKK